MDRSRSQPASHLRRATRYADALEFLSSLDRYGIKPGLARIERLCELAGHPEASFPSVLVGGTNGKGSTCAFLASILTAAGHRVGSAPKPHLYTPRERLQVAGELCPETDFAALTAEVAPLIEQVAAEPERGPVTYFEAMTLMAFLCFARRRVDWAVVEVGLGGRLDATNVLAPRLSAITNIGLDHTDRLGPDLASIAGEKAGILRPGRPSITGAGGEGLAVIEAEAGRLASPLWRLGREIWCDVGDAGELGSRFDLQTPAGRWEELEITLPGEHQVRNASLAAAAALRLIEEGAGVSDEALRTGLSAARLPGRLERLQERPLLLIDAAHNPDGARELVRSLQEIYLAPHPGRRLILVLGLSEAHAPEEMARGLAPVASHLVCTASRHPQAVPAARTAELSRPYLPAGAACEVVAEVPAAVAAGLAAARANDVVCVTGSIFTIAEVGRGS
jgi:dihydrofolate synthase/folylpolyglutamate synthase